MKVANMSPRVADTDPFTDEFGNGRASARFHVKAAAK